MVHMVATPHPGEEVDSDPTLAHETDTWWWVLVDAVRLGASRVEFRRPSARCLRFITASGAPTEEPPLQPPVIIRGQMAIRALQLLSPNRAVCAWRRFLSRCCGFKINGEFELIVAENRRVRWQLSYSEAGLAFHLLSHEPSGFHLSAEHPHPLEPAAGLALDGTSPPPAQ